MGVKRRDLLRGRFARRENVVVLRPPWSLPEKAFLERCTRCGACVQACTESVLVNDASGYPTVQFTEGACTFCGACEAACESGALTGSTSGNNPWEAKASISEGCLALTGVACQSCRDVCDEKAIRFRPQLGGWPQPVMDESRCTGCGACVVICPVKAIEVQNKADVMEGHSWAAK